MLLVHDRQIQYIFERDECPVVKPQLELAFVMPEDHRKSLGHHLLPVLAEGPWCDGIMD